MRQTSAETETAAVQEAAPAACGFWAKARELAEWMEEQDSRSN